MICRIQERGLSPAGLLIGGDKPQSVTVVANECGSQRAKVISSEDGDEFATASVFNLMVGGPDRTRICDLYRVKVAL